MSNSIIEKTVLITGAGASVNYDLPTGEGLIKNIQSFKEEPDPYRPLLVNGEYHSGNIRDLTDKQIIILKEIVEELNYPFLQPIWGKIAAKKYNEQEKNKFISKILSQIPSLDLSN